MILNNKITGRKAKCPVQLLLIKIPIIRLSNENYEYRFYSILLDY